MIRNFKNTGPVKAERNYIADTYTVEIRIDGASDVWETYRARVIRGRYDCGSDKWDVFVRVDKSKSEDHWRILCCNRQYRRIHAVVGVIERELKKAAA